VAGIDGNERVGCAFSDHWLVNSRGEVLFEESMKNTEFYNRDKLKSGLVPSITKADLFVNFSVPLAMAALINRKAIDTNDYPQEIAGAYDRWILLQLVKNDDWQFFYLDERLTNYRTHEQSVTSTNPLSVIKASIYILTRAKKVLRLTTAQRKTVNDIIRSYIHNMIKRQRWVSFNTARHYCSLYIQ